MMERMNEVRDREKVMRGLNNLDSPILKGMQIHHYFVRPHMGLNGKTPSEVAGIQSRERTSGLRLSRMRPIRRNFTTRQRRVIRLRVDRTSGAESFL